MTDVSPRIIGNYELGPLLGRGGTSEVYAAEHRFLGDAVAVKLLRAPLADDEAVRAGFLDEAAKTREIQHPGVVRVLDFGHDEASGCCYLVMERIEGPSLAARLRDVGRLEEATLRALAAEIADGMQAAHERGIVHRDLKPGNVMLRGAHPTIVDFGIAKSLGEQSAVVTARRVGTVAYMAPEQLTDGLITPAVDIWALGVLLYEAATGRAPFERFADGRLPQLFESPPRAATLAPISRSLDELIARCLERDPGKRPATMAAIARTLRGHDEERITEEVGARLLPVQPLPNTKRPLAFAIGAAVLVGGAALAFVALQRDTPLPPPAPPAPVAAPVAPSPAPPDAGVELVEETAKQEEPVRKRKVRKPPAKQPPRTTQGETLD